MTVPKYYLLIQITQQNTNCQGNTYLGCSITSGDKELQVLTDALQLVQILYLKSYNNIQLEIN